MKEEKLYKMNVAQMQTFNYSLFFRYNGKNMRCLIFFSFLSPMLSKLLCNTRRKRKNVNVSQNNISMKF